jgi:hypothetical protein
MSYYQIKYVKFSDMNHEYLNNYINYAYSMETTYYVHNACLPKITVSFSVHMKYKKAKKK